MSKRNYNVFFNTHTVSGIIISVGLFIIFFAGAFSLFKDEIKIWQEGNPIENTELKSVNFDEILSDFDKKYELHGRDISLTFGDNIDEIRVFLTASNDTIYASEKGKEGHFFYADLPRKQHKNYEENYSLGEFLFRLHFLDQIPRPIGIHLAGLIALFFTFAIITGIIVHWKKMVQNFYFFNPKAILKRVWTDAHTALGVIGLPFQFIYGITGAFFTLTTLVLLPANFLYNGNREKLQEDLLDRKTEKWIEKSSQDIPSIDNLIKKYESHFSDFEINRASINNYGGRNMKLVLKGKIPSKKHFVGTGKITIDIFSDKVESFKNPTESNYLKNTKTVLGRLHFANYGGITTKIIYFILAIITCFVIITGVLIWIEARNKKSMSLKDRLYTVKVGHIYLAICLSMLPVTALAFSFVRISEGMFADKKSAIMWFYFLVWLLFILFYRFKRNNYFTNKNSLLLGAIFGFLVPIVNGITSGNWFWKTYTNQHEIFTIDVFWIVVSSVALLFYFSIKPTIKERSSFAKNPIDYKTINEQLALEKSEKSTILTDENQIDIPMKTKIVILWIFLAIGWIVHHLYGVFSIYYNESVMMEGATGEAPMIHHIYRILFEGLCLLFALLTIELSKKSFVWTSFIFAIISGLYNVYHLITAIIYESSNISELFMLSLMVIASVFLIKNLDKWRKLD